MGNSLGIKIKVDYASIDDLAKKIDQLTKDKLEVDIHLNTDKSLGKLKEFQNKYEEFKKTVENGFDLKVNTNNGFDKALESMKDNASKVTGVISDARDQAAKMNEQFKNSEGSLSSLTRTVKTLAGGTKQTTDSMTKDMNSYSKSVETIVNGEQRSLKTVTDKRVALKEIAGVMSEIGSLNVKSLSSDTKSKEAISQRTDALKSQLSSLQSLYKTTFNEDSSQSRIVSETRALGEYNLQLQKASIEKQNQAQKDKETEGILRQIVQLENERYALTKKAGGSGDEESSLLRKQANLIQDKSNELIKQSGLLERITVGQEDSLNVLRKENDAAIEYSSNLAKAKAQDAAKAQAQAQAYREIKSQMQDVYAIQEKINSLQALQNNGSISGKEESKLGTLRQELSVRQEMLGAIRNQASQEGNLTSKQQESLSAIQKEKSYKLQSAQASAEINAEARKTDQYYNEIASSMKKVHTLSAELANAGNNESRVIKNIIELEERRQSVIRNTLSIQGKVNSAREGELNTLRKQDSELQQQNSRRSKASQADNIGNTGILGNMLNPISIANDVRQAAMTIYDSIAPIDAQLVNIAKVAEEPQEQLDAFAETIYQTATSVGKSAEEYGVSVERWVTAGKTLNESVDLAKTSTMGAFVGNIDEANMVDYMSVPLNAYKKSALEANDIINAMNEVANKNAIEMDDMGLAYKRAASTSAQAGTSFAQLTGIITAGQESTRVGGETLGTAIKAMDVNFGKMATRTTKMDNAKFEFFQNIGVQVKDSNGQLRSTFDILQDLSGVWGKLNNDQKTQAGFYASGKQFANVFSGILGSWDTVTKATKEAQDQVDLIDSKTGSAFQEFDKQQSSIQFKAASLKNSWAEFLSVVAGGKDGVTKVMASLNDGLQLAIKLAGDDRIRSIATNILKVVATLTAATAISKFFSVITAGSVAAISSLTGVTRAMSSMQRVSGAYKVSKATDGAFKATKATQQVSKAAKASKVVEGVGETAVAVGAMGKVTGAIQKTTGAAKAMTGGLRAGLTTVATVGSKAIPIIGGVFTAIELLELVGVPVWGTLFNVVKKFTGGTDKAKDSLKEYNSTQEATKKSLSENKLFTGAIGNTNNLVKSYNELAAAKEKAMQEEKERHAANGEKFDIGLNLHFTPEEFEKVKKDFNDKAKDLGIDTRITVNNWDDIKAKFKELGEVNLKVTKVETKKLGKDLEDLGQYADVKKQFDSFNEKAKNKSNDIVKKARGDKKDEETSVAGGMNRKFSPSYYDSKIKDAQKYSKQNGDFYASNDMAEMEKTVNKRISTLEKTRESLISAMNQGVLKDTFGDFDGETQKKTLAVLTSQIPIIQQEQKQYKDINTQIEKGGKLSIEQVKALEDKGIKLQGLSDTAGTWYSDLLAANGGDAKAAQEQYNQLIQSIKKAGTESDQSQANLQANLRTLGKTAGMSEDDINHMIDVSKKGGVEYIQYMARFGDMGATIVGVTAKIQTAAAQYGTTWSEIASEAQKSINVISQMDGGKEKLIRFKLVKEDGSVNYDELDDAYALPDEVKKTFNLVNTETGGLNIGQITDYLAKVNSQENKKFMLDLKVNGEVNMETLAQIYALPAETIKTFKIINEKTGMVDWESFAKSVNDLPDEVKKTFKFDTDVDKNGKIDLDDTIAILKTLSSSDLKDITTKVTTKVTGGKETKEARDAANDMDGKEYVIAINAEGNANRVIKLVEKGAETLGKGDYTAFLKANPQNANTSIEDTSAKLSAYNKLSPEAKLDINNQNALVKFAQSLGLIVEFDGKTGEAKFTGNAEDVKGKSREAVKAKDEGNGSANVNFNGNSTSVVLAGAEAKSARDNASGLVTTTFNAAFLGDWDKPARVLGIVQGTAPLLRPGQQGSGSVAIGTGSSFSASIGSQIGSSLSSAISDGVSQSRTDESKPSTVNEDVWRYWGKELFTGLPLENSLDKLSKSIDDAGENQDQLIALYKQQIPLYEKQISYQNSLNSSRQDEIKSTIDKLWGYGFKSNGNKITNLDQARNLSGDRASEADTLLSKWKELYSSINETQKTISELNSSKKQAEDNIKDAKTAKELKKIEATLKKTEVLLKLVENNTSIQNVKESFVGANDYELSLSIKEQGLNTSSGNIKTLIDEYNKLSQTSVEYSENAEQVQSTLENLKSTILSNSDSIIKYREELNSIRIDRLVNDYDKFSGVIEKSISRITDNIDNLKNGLVSGTTLSDLYSSQFGSLDLTRKTKLEKEQEERLQLEAELDSALDGYAKKNVDRTESVANSILTIEKDKYQKLLAMAKSYTDGTPLKVSKNTVGSIGTGYSTAQPSANKDKYSEWTKNIQKISSDYSKAYSNMVKKYDASIKNAKTSAQKELLTNNMIISQLKLQESMYDSMIKTNNQMIANAEDELKNTSLTTDQKDKLKESIEKYKDSNIDAQKAIKDSIGARYEFEFSLIDKSAEKAEKYSKNLSYLLSIAELINMSASAKSPIYESIFAGKINEYKTAKKNLASLIKEQSKFEKGSYEWKLLQDKIDSVTDSLHDLTTEALNANKDLLDNSLDSAQNNIEKGLLGGKTLDEWNDYQENWMTGINKELELEAIRKRMVGLENDVISKRLEALDRQEAVSKKDIEYLDKQIAVMELQKKLNGIEKERNVQTLVRGDDGKWAWAYVADQTEYDSTKKDLDEAKKALADYQNEQRKNYVESLGGIIGNAKDGKYKNPEDLASAIANLNSVYGNILSDIPDLNYGSIDDIVAAYQKYLAANSLIVGDATGTGTALTQQTIDNIGIRFENSFLNIADKLGEIIGKELRSALGLISGEEKSGISGSYTIQKQELQFPNVTDANGIEAVFRDLPKVTEQLLAKK